MPKNTQLQRQEIRQQIRTKRRDLSAQEQTLAGEQLLAKLITHPKVKTAKNIAIFLSQDGEINTEPFILWCWQQGITVTLPVIHPFNLNHLLFLRYQATSTMVNNSFNIAEPQLRCPDIVPLMDIDVIFTPLVAFDNKGERLGMGGGFYDRTLALWHKGNASFQKLYPIGIAHDCQQVDKIPTEPWDIPIPEIITPNQTVSNKI